MQTELNTRPLNTMTPAAAIANTAFLTYLDAEIKKLQAQQHAIMGKITEAALHFSDAERKRVGKALGEAGVQFDWRFDLHLL